MKCSSRFLAAWIFSCIDLCSLWFAGNGTLSLYLFAPFMAVPFSPWSLTLMQGGHIWLPSSKYYQSCHLWFSNQDIMILLQAGSPGVSTRDLESLRHRLCCRRRGNHSWQLHKECKQGLALWHASFHAQRGLYTILPILWAICEYSINISWQILDLHLRWECLCADTRVKSPAVGAA